MKLKRLSKKCYCVIKLTKNNMFINLSKENGSIIAEMSGGNIGMSGAKKRTVYAAKTLGKTIGEKGVLQGYKNATVVVHKGMAKNVKQLIVGLISSGITIESITLLKKEAHNGVRLKKGR